MEVAPIFIGFPILIATYRRFPLTSLLYVLIFFHALILMTGGAYTYARVPLGDWVKEAFSLSRNPYDKLGHFFQGLVPAMLAKEIFVRGRFVSGGKMVAFLAVCVAMALSSFYELIEWWTALALGQGADDFLGTQGDPWDTQSDMFMAMIGGLFAIWILGRWHNAQIRSMPTRVSH